ncbi:MAG: hypothetical protein IJW99_03550 [Clostridia bacterium]|nr:hypothetical protein [Clostridia bacterium]
MDRSYPYIFPEEGGRKPKRRSPLPIIAATVALILLVGAGIGAYIVWSPPAITRAAQNTLSDLLGETGAIERTLETLRREGEEKGTDVTLKATLPAELTGWEPLELMLRAVTAPGEEPTARYEVELSADGTDDVSLTLFETADALLAQGLYPEERSRAVRLSKEDLTDRLEKSAWNPAVGDGALNEEEFQSLMDLARAIEEAEQSDVREYSEEEQREIGKALAALRKECRRILAPRTERVLRPRLTKTVTVEYDYEKLALMLSALRRVMDDYPAFAELLRTGVTFGEYGGELLPDDAVVEASLPTASHASPQPLSAESETEGDGLEKLLDSLEEWLEGQRANSHFAVKVTLSVCQNRLSAVTADYLYDGHDGNRQEYALTLTFHRPARNTEEAQTLATALLRGKQAWAATEETAAGESEQGAYLCYSRRQTADEREYLLTIAEDPALAEEPSATPEPLAAETDGGDPAAWAAQGRVVLQYDPDAEEYRFALEEREAESEEWQVFLETDGTWRLSDRGNRLELGWNGMTVAAPVYDEKGEETDEVNETEIKASLSLVWQLSDGEAPELPADAKDILDYTAEEIRTLLEGELITDVAEVLTAAFGDGTDVIYTLDGVKLRGAAYYQNHAGLYITLYSEYLAREGDDALTRLSVYDEELDLYVMLDFSRRDNYLAVNFLNIYSEAYRAVYHPGTIENGQLIGHRFVVTEETQASCKHAGRTVRLCGTCKQYFTEETPPHAHRMRTWFTLKTYDNGRQVQEGFRHCEYCGGGEDGIWEGGGYIFTLLTPFDRDEVGLAQGRAYMSPYSSALTVPDYMDAESGGKFPVTIVSAFSDQSFYSLEILRMGRNVRTIDSYACTGATGLQVLVLYPALEEIGEDAFKACTSLRRVYFCGTEEQWARVRIAKGNDPLKNAEIIFGHDGSSVGGAVIGLNQAKEKLRTLTAASRDGMQGTLLSAHPDADLLTVISTPAASLVAYDDQNDAVFVCGGYDEVSGVTAVRSYDAKTGSPKETLSLPYRVNAMDAGDGYLVFGERDTVTVHLYRLSDHREVVSYRVPYMATDDGRDRIGQVFIDRGVVISCNSEQHCTIDFYNIETGKHVSGETVYEPALAIDKTTHTLAAINQNSSPKSIYFYDTQTGQQIRWHWNVDTSAPIRFTGNAFETASMYFSVAGDIIGEPAGLAAKTDRDTIVLETVAQGTGYVFWVAASVDPATGGVRTGLMVQSTARSLSAPLEFYGGQILQLGSDSRRFLIWDEGYRELVILNLN